MAALMIFSRERAAVRRTRLVRDLVLACRTWISPKDALPSAIFAAGAASPTEPDKGR